MENKSNFIMAAINDAQATIRATDVKVGALLTGLLLPISYLEHIWAYASLPSTHCKITVFVVIFFVFWLLAILSLIRTISAIDNPSNHIVNSDSCKGSFYSGGLYTFGVVDSLLNRSIIKANKDITSFSLDYPSTEDEINSELSFEHLKLIYIRDIKLYRLNFALKIASVGLFIGISIYTFIQFI